MRIPAVLTGTLMLAAQAGANMVEYHPTVRERILSSIANPNIALALLIAGALGIYAECIMPGRIVPGVVGGILLLLGLSEIRFLPINWLGAALIALALALFPLEVKFASRGMLGLAGAVALVLGARMLVGSPSAEPRIHWSTALALGAPFSGVTVYLLTIAARARRNKRETAI